MTKPKRPKREGKLSLKKKSLRALDAEGLESAQGGAGIFYNTNDCQPQLTVAEPVGAPTEECATQTCHCAGARVGNTLRANHNQALRRR